MNSLEAQRVLTVLDDAVEGLRLLSYITPEVLAAADQLGGVLGQDVFECLQQHAAALMDLPEDFQPHQLIPTSSALLRALKKRAGVGDALSSLQSSRSPAVIQMVSCLERHREQVHKRLTTTVEEDATNRDHHALLAERREKAAAERLQLEHMLKLQRIEMAKQIGALQAAYDAAAAELAELRGSAAAETAATESEALASTKANTGAFAAEHAILAEQLESAHSELMALRSDNRAAAAAARKARKRAEQDCEAAIAEYDAELTARQKEYDQALAAYTELQDQLKKNLSEVEALKAERLAHEEAVRAAAASKKREEIRSIRIAAAAYAIQNAYKVWKKRKAAEAKKASAKGSKAGKGKKK
eukprot:GHRR01012481.1.p1 GENE.GHRR01012481.1~~GHRR01012481.1.p1  ORF type:complete len:359 (+),score=170.19 GHRR01012481.1:214-1290(+)